MTLERFKEWVEKEYPIDRYSNVYDLINDVEQRVNSDGNEMNPQVRQLLLEQFLPQFDAQAREILERQKDKEKVSDLVGGALLRGTTDEMIADLQKSEVMGIDTSQMIPPKPEPETRSQYVYRILNESISKPIRGVGKQMRKFGKWLGF